MLYELNGLSCFVLSCCLKRSTSRRQLCLNFNNLLSNLVKTVSAMRWFGEVGSLENFLFSIILYKTVCVSNVPGVHIGTLARSLWFLQNILNSKLWLVNGVHEGCIACLSLVRLCLLSKPLLRSGYTLQNSSVRPYNNIT